MKSLSKILTLLTSIIFLSACKIAIISIEGGGVYSDVPNGGCTAGNICMFEVEDSDFQRAFFSNSAEGFVFVRWNEGDHFLCGGSKNPMCTVSLQSVSTETAEQIVASSETAYLMPIFRRSKDIIEVAGKEWYQPDLFSGLSWYEISAVCPNGICSGFLNGYKLTGWSWASVKDMNDLFNYYIGSNLMGPGPDEEYLHSVATSNLFFYDWHPTHGTGASEFGYYYFREIRGWTKDALNARPNSAWFAEWSDVNGEAYSASTRLFASKQDSTTGKNVRGAWFYREL